MKTKAYALLLIAMLAAGATGAVAAWHVRAGWVPVSDTQNSEEWTCGMHPTVVRSSAGACPICGMDLVLRRTASQTNHNHLIHVDPAIRQAIGVRTSLVKQGPLTRRLRILARVVPDERRESVVTSKYAGWVEKLYVNESGQVVRPGDPLLLLYSPEVYAGQQELLLAERQGNRALVESAKERLRSLDLTERQLKRILSDGKALRAITRYAQVAGHVLKKHVVNGQYVTVGQPLYQIVDLARVWVEAEVYEYDVAWLRLGQRATLRLEYARDRNFAGRVVFIYPAVDEASRTIRVRLEFDNPDLVMRPGMFGIVQLEGSQSADVLHISDTAVLRSGRRDVVFVALGDGHFEPREVVVGRSADNGRIEVRSGLRFGERVVTRSQFLLDSESRLREAIDKMLPAASSRPASQPESRPSSAPASQPAAAAASLPASRPASQPASRPASQPASRPTSAPATSHGTQP